MKNLLKILGVFTLTALIGFTSATCDNNKNNDNDNKYTLNQIDESVDIDNITAVEFVSKMRIGWNLGNTLDSAGGGNTVAGMETAWLNPKIQTTKENITTLKNAGFNVIRIPVTWSRAAPAPDYNIRADWMARVTEIVDYAVDNDMFIILNTHHDEGIFKFMNSNAAASKIAFEKIWKQIADNFKDHDDGGKLIFEALNEPRTRNSGAEWNGGTSEEHKNLNAHHQIFVDVVRASGGKNANRFLLINPYAASAEPSAMNGLVLPIDTAKDRLIVSYHSYSPYFFALSTNKTYNTWSENNSSDKSQITSHMDRYYDKFVKNDIPVIIGEFGAMNKDNEDVRAEWAEFYVGYARSKDIPCVWWDNGATTGDGELFGLLNREKNTFVYTKLLAGLMKGAGAE